jgi:5-formyltetrahydrofolate cyclo-ligase
MGGRDDQIKTRLRRELLARRRAIDPARVAAASRAACEHLLGHNAIRDARHVVAYACRDGELDPRALLRRLPASTPVYLPRAVGDLLRFHHAHPTELRPGRFGVPEPPATAPPLDPGAAGVVILVPAIALDRRGVRLGSGRGFYDRTLPGFPGAMRIGLVAEELVVDRLPEEPWDVRMDAVATDAGVTVVGRSDTGRTLHQET